jgi:dephospho-CoA kinase
MFIISARALFYSLNKTFLIQPLKCMFMNICITGTICSGKSHVLRCFSRLGADTLDIDKLAYRLYDPYDPQNANLDDAMYKAVIEQLGEGIIDEEHQYRRLSNPKLREICLSDDAKLQAISEIAKVYMRPAIQDIIGQGGLLYAEAAMLFEYEWEDLFDKTIVIAVNHEIRVQRFIARNDITREFAEHWISRQMPQEEKIARADTIFWNNAIIPEGKEFTDDDPLFMKCKQYHR